MSSVKECNIILLGEIGVGKSLFINSFANYFQYGSFEEGIQNPTTLISSIFGITDANQLEHVINAGEKDANELSLFGESNTTKCKSYRFKFADLVVRLIDTPGVGSGDDELTDVDKVAEILSFINQLDDLHAIAVVMGNNATKMTDRYSYCLKTLLSKINKTALNNLLFILTFSKGHDFEPGPAKEVIKLFIEKELKNSKLVVDKKVVYCVDNKNYDYMVAAHRGLQFNEKTLDSQKCSWKYSSAEMTRLLTHVGTLIPHKIEESSKLNEAKNLIRILRPFMTEIVENINENTIFINKLQNDVLAHEENSRYFENLKFQDIEIVEILKAIRFCTSAKCRQVFRIGDEEKYHYSQKCCEGCLVNNGWGRWCVAMDWSGNCKVCGCPSGEHDRRYFKTKKTSSMVYSFEDIEKIKMTPSAKKQVQMQIEMLTKKKTDLIYEKTVIESAEQKFSNFLQAHVLVTPPEPRECEENGVFSSEKMTDTDDDKEISIADSIYQFDILIKKFLLDLPIYGAKIKQVLEAKEKEKIYSFLDEVTIVLNKNILCA